MSLATKLKELRLSKGNSLQQVADAVGASKAYIWELEKGASKKPSMDIISRLARHFDISVAELVGHAPSSDDEEELWVMYRDLKELNDEDRETLRFLISSFKKRRTKDDEGAGSD